MIHVHVPPVLYRPDHESLVGTSLVIRHCAVLQVGPLVQRHYRSNRRAYTQSVGHTQLCGSRCRYKSVAQQRGFSAANLSASRDAWARWPRPGAAVRIQERAAWAPKRRLPCINTRGSSGSGPSPVHRIGRVPRVLPARPDPCASRASRWNQR